jgi:hypothetical protein
MKFTLLRFKTYHLDNTIPPNILSQLQRLTLGAYNGCTFDIFHELPRKKGLKRYLIRVCFLGKHVIAWAMRFNNELHCFTDKNYRCNGIQSNHLLPFIKRRFPKYNFHTYYRCTRIFNRVTKNYKVSFQLNK